MTPIPLILPLKAGEAAALADLIYQQVEGRPLSDDVRNRFAARGPSLELKTFTPYPGSLQQDPIHPSTYYIAVDAHGGGAREPLLLRIALDSSPASGLFPGTLLIGRMRTAGGREIVLNAIPFAPADRDNIGTFAGKVDRAFLPRPKGTQSSISVRGGDPEAAFRGFRSILKSAGVNLAAFECPYYAGIWAAIRAGWREGYSLGAEPIAVAGKMEDEILSSVGAAEYTRFTMEAARRDFPLVERLHQHITRIKAGQDSWKHFDFELSLTGADELRPCLEELKTRGCLPQMVEPDTYRDRMPELVEVARHFNVTLSFRHRGGEGAAELEEIDRATGGRFHYKISGDADLRQIASCLLGMSIPT
jgi:hypothetical protein